MASITKLAMEAAEHSALDLDSANIIIHQQQEQISALLQQLQQRQCGPEFKLPGLYVMGSIIQPSRYRYQFGAEKDSFGLRFAKNFQKTFQGLFQCAPEGKPKVIRVLNLAVPPPSVPPPSSSTSSNQHSALDLDSANVIIHQQQQQISALLQQLQQLQSQANSFQAPILQALLDDFDYSDEEEEDVEERIARQRERIARQSEKARLSEHDISVSESRTDDLKQLQLLREQFIERELATAIANTQRPEINPPSQLAPASASENKVCVVCVVCVSPADQPVPPVP